MAISEIYVDPSIAADSGTGTIGDPFGDLEYAIEQTTFDTTNGTRVNIKAGTDEVLAAKLETAMEDTVTTAAWVTSEPARMVLEGYTAVAGDGGIGGISGGGSVPVFADASKNYVVLKNLHIHNVGTQANIVNLNNYIHVEGCEFDNVTGSCLAVDTYSLIRGCYFHNFSGVGIGTSVATHCYDNYVDGSSTTVTTQMINCTQAVCSNNIVITTGGGEGIQAGEDAVVVNNSIYSDGGTGEGIDVGNNVVPMRIANNLIEGFSGAGGDGINFAATNSGCIEMMGNAVYDCTTAYGTPTVEPHYTEDNETLTASPFTDAANGDFSPVDTGNVKEGSLPNVIGGGLV